MIQPYYPEELDPMQLGRLIHTPLAPDSPLVLQNNLTETDILSIPMMKLTLQFLVDIQHAGKIKLVRKGELPPDFVRKMYSYGIFPDAAIDKKAQKIRQEQDFFPAHFAHLICRKAGLLQTHPDHLQLHKKGEAALTNVTELYRELLVTFTTDYSWNYPDTHPPDVAQLGWAYTLYVFLLYGNVGRSTDFYAQKYLELFPDMLDSFEPTAENYPTELFLHCFRNRFFRQFCTYFGLADLQEFPDTSGTLTLYVRKSKLTEKVFAVRPGVREN